MGKGYVENSLKRFLKRKVKITLGIVVSFLITGMVSFGAEEGSIIEGNGTYISHDTWLDGIGAQENILKEDIKIGNDIVLSKDIVNNKSTLMSTVVKQNIKNVSSLITGKDVKLENDNEDYNLGLELKKVNSGLADNNILRADGKGTISINGKDWTGELKDAEEIDGKDTGKGVQIAINGGKAVNYGNITIKYDTSTNSQNKGWGHSGQTARNNSEVYNYGTMTSREMVQRAELNSNAYNYGTLIGTHVQYAKENGRIYNYGTIKTDNYGQNILNDSLAVNYGVIVGTGEAGQGVNGNNSILKNYGVIAIDSQRGQNSAGAENIEIYNYGIIANKGEEIKNELVGLGQVLNSKHGSGFNYGLIVNKGNFGQRLAGENSEIYNYGLIANDGKVGQETQGKNNTGYNYGVITNSNVAGQYVAGDKGGNKAINYGIIANNGDDGQIATASAVAENYGIIANKGNKGQYSYGIKDGDITNILNNGIINNSGDYGMGVAEEHKGENNGIVFNHTDKNVLYGNITNNGVIIIKDSGTGAYGGSVVKKGIQIDASINDIKISQIEGDMLVATNQNDDVVKDKKFDSSKNLENGKNLFVDRYTTNGKLAETVTLDNTELKGNHITTVLGKDDKTDKAVISTKDDLTLNNSTIIGYFEKNGTLLNVNGNLTLSGNSVINAIAGNEYTGYKGNALNNVVAVKLNENGTLTIGENSKVFGAVKGNGTLVYENIDDELYSNTQEVDSTIIRTTDKNTTKIALANLTLKDSGTGVENAGKLIIDNQSSEKLKDKEVSTSITLANNINIEKGIDGSSSANGIELVLGDGQTSSDKTINIDSITLGTENDVLTIKNILGTVGEINGNGGKDIVKLEKSAGDTFDYKLKNIDTLDLGNSTWKIGKNAEITHNATTKADEKTTIQNGTLAGELQGTSEKGVEFINNEAVNKVIGNSTFGENAKFQMNIGKDMKLEAGAEYNFDDTTKNNLVGIKDKVTASAIFTKATEQGKDIRIKSAKEMNIDERYSGIYEEMLKNASSDSEILDTLNKSDVSSIANAINGKGALGDTLATTGYKITRDISNSFMSAVNEWDKKADKGEWLTNAKYISSDVEYDGANNVKGYDSDINSMVGMIEYGVSENTAYGIALGGGDTEIDVKDAGTLKGDNYYIGAYAKHSVNGFDLVGNLGYTISDLEVNGEGSADSSAITFGGYIKKDVALTETVRIEPNFSFTYDYIMQDNGEGNGVKVDNKDIHVFEASAGMNIVKGFNLETGVLELKAGAKYSMADVNRNEETVISVYGIDDINLGSPEVDKTRGTANIGFDYEHNSGFGVNGKYEMMWSDSGDDSRITAGISYRF